VFGCGAIGSAFGGFLSTSRHEVVVYGRKWHLDLVRTSGLKVSGIWGRHTFKRFHICTRLDELQKQRGSFDLVLLSVKSFDTRRACRDLRSIVSPHSVILSLQNGLGNIEILHEYFPKKQVLAARVIFGVELSPGRIKITVWGGDVLLGETVGRTVTTRVKELAKLLIEAGIRTKAVSDIRSHIWGKVIYNSALNPLASLLGVHYGALLEIEDTKLVMKQLVHEAYQVAQKQKIKLAPGTAQAYVHLLFNRLIPDTYDHHPSMLFDLKRRRKTEIDSLNGAICRLAARSDIPVSANRFVTDMIRTV